MKKLLVICGPTATGKTKLALHLAKVFDGEVISADSRQVYKGMDIGTGKELPKNVKAQMSSVKVEGGSAVFYEIDGVRVWGYDLVDPKYEFSVTNYINFFNNIIGSIYDRDKLPILVGGTGLYIKAVVDGLDTAFIPQNKNLRKLLKGKDIKELLEILSSIDPIKAAELNQSDRKNPRRLIRAIEIGQWSVERKKLYKTPDKKPRYETFFIGLITQKPLLFKIIEKRILRRIQSGLELEIKNITKKGVDWYTHSMTALGYKIWRNYFLGRESKQKVIDRWLIQERKYAKRQITWFKKDKRIKWFDISEKKLHKNVENEVRKWYYSKVK